jgi:uncharacterized Fe-S cluster-containing MiaB family protein
MFLITIGFWAPLAFGADIDEYTDQEIRHLTAYLRTAQCEFFRSGCDNSTFNACFHKGGVP